MFDLALTDSGDIDFSITESLPHCKVSFLISEYNGQIVNFITTPKKQIKATGQCKVSFEFVKEDTYQMQAEALEDIDESIQAIKLQLRTELYDVRNNALGTNFYQYKHNVIRKDEDLEEIRYAASQIVHSILPEADVIVQFETSSGYFYCQTVRITITMKDDFIVSFIL